MVAYDQRFVQEVMGIENESEVLTSRNNEEIMMRYSLKVRLKKRKGGKEVAIIMMNPSAADENDSDRSVNKVLEHIYKKQNDFEYVTILNIIPFYSTENKKIKEKIDKIISHKNAARLNAINESNNKEIEETVKRSQKVILAWGKPSKFPLFYYYNQLSNIISYLEKHPDVNVFKLRSYRLNEDETNKKPYCLTSSGDPGHPSYAEMLGIRKISIDKYFGVKL
ncbi:DUF1643 domain-containing protein [Salinicoccus sp. HZC-1]|uniref:DUF1643 domain-containing protein n=1 Tax=Salinicoccus sp. HZC-1 TaxID=3385497 RepID=UPI00398B439C